MHLVKIVLLYETETWRNSTSIIKKYTVVDGRYFKSYFQPEVELRKGYDAQY